MRVDPAVKFSKSRQNLHAIALPILALCPGTVLLLFALGIVPLVRFPEEAIYLTAHAQSIEVRGIYIYKNPWPFPVRQGFGLPLPVDSSHPVPFPVELTLMSTNEPLPISSLCDRLGFELSFGPGETKPVELYYRQEATRQSARYILTTTRPWLQTLSRGAYRLRCEGVEPVSSTYSMKKCGLKEWGWSRANFLPDYDWEITWRNKGS